MPGANKRGPVETMEGKKRKRQKMDYSVTQKCYAILKQLMNHPYGWVFEKPVDPVALGIPDYFSIILKPMDLGTVKSNLNKDMYVGTKEFAADIRLIFSNAMVYNPPANDVHKIAKELSTLFESRWKSLEAKWTSKMSKVEQRPNLSEGKEAYGTRQSSPKTPPLHSHALPKRSISSENFTRNDARAAKVELAKSSQNCMYKPLLKECQQGIKWPTKVSTTDIGSKHACGSVDTKSRLSLASRKCYTCGSIKCQCNIISDSTCISSSVCLDISSDRLTDRFHLACVVDASKQKSLEKGSSKSQMIKSHPNSDGAVCDLDDVHIIDPCSELKTPVTDALSGEGFQVPPLDVQLSPKKALRAVMLKSRFADTILKAEQKMLQDHGDNADPVKMQQEKERLQKKQHAEKARIEAQLKAAEDALRLREETLMKKREWEREAARIAVQKMEKTVEFEDNLKILKELEMLSGCPLSSRRFSTEEVSLLGAFEGVNFRNPLQWLGLSIKDDYLEDEDVDPILNEEGEEGEIFS